jgi:hypothetical protein
MNALTVIDRYDIGEATMPPLGLSGFAQTGKTTAANYLQRCHGYTRHHIAEPLRDMLRTLLRRFGMDDELIDRYLIGDLKEEVIPCLGVTSRWAQISIGTEWGRDQIDDDLWARLWAHEVASLKRPMNDSVRFPNEEREIRSIGGATILIRRKGTHPAAFKWGIVGKLLYRCFRIMWGVHGSERTDRLNPDYVIDNDGCLDDLYHELDSIVAELYVKSLK